MDDNSKCHVLKNVVCNVKVGCSVPYITFPTDSNKFSERLEEYKERIEKWVRDFNDFLRDHRSQDSVYLTVIREMEDICSHCGKKWEVAEDHGVMFCAHCGTDIERNLE
jgi:hypothetical protein